MKRQENCGKCGLKKEQRGSKLYCRRQAKINSGELPPRVRVRGTEVERAYSRMYYEKNRDRLVEQKRAYDRANGAFPRPTGSVPCRSCGLIRAVSTKCKPCERKRDKQYKIANADRIIAYRKNLDPEVMREKRRQWRAENPEKHQFHKSRRRARQNSANGSYTEIEWKRILKTHKNSCATCGISGKIEKMTVDHIIPLSRGGTNFAFNLQPLCRSCNSRKQARIASGAQHSLFDRIAA